ncbi:MAG: type II toxin-antitoxin system VapC family toxin [Polyangiaceae bacterium]
MTRFLLDTSTIAAVVWKVPSSSVLTRLTEHGGECATCAPVWHELQFGVRRLPRGRRRTALEGFLEEVVRATLPIFPYDERAAEWHGEERARLERSGKKPPFVDGQIAAIAVTCGIRLITANPADFKSFKGLVVENWVGGR